MDGKAQDPQRTRRWPVSGRAACRAGQPGMGSGRAHSAVSADRHGLPVHRQEQWPAGGYARLPEQTRMEEPRRHRPGAAGVDCLRPADRGSQRRIPQSVRMARAVVAGSRSNHGVGHRSAHVRITPSSCVHEAAAIFKAQTSKQGPAFSYAPRSMNGADKCAAHRRRSTTSYAIRRYWRVNSDPAVMRREAYIDLAICMWCNPTRTCHNREGGCKSLRLFGCRPLS